MDKSARSAMFAKGLILVSLAIAPVFPAETLRKRPDPPRVRPTVRTFEPGFPQGGEARYWMGIMNAGKEPIAVCIFAAFYSVVCHTQQSMEGSIVPASAHSCRSSMSYRLILAGETLFTLAAVRAPKECVGPARLTLGASVLNEDGSGAGRVREELEIGQDILIGSMPGRPE
jgi:hypothetical protein